MLLLTDKEITARIINKTVLKRKALKLTQKELAQRAGLSYRTIQEMESGAAPNLKTLIAILRALGELQLLDAFLQEEMISPKQIHQEKINGKKSKTIPA